MTSNEKPLSKNTTTNELVSIQILIHNFEIASGKIVKLIMPPNDKGMAFGEKKGKIGGRKTKGYFPMECVVPAD